MPFLLPNQRRQSTGKTAAVLRVKCCITAATYWITFPHTAYSYTSQWAGRCHPPKLPPFLQGSRPLPTILFLGPTWVQTPNGIWIGLAILAQVMVMSNRPSYRYICSVGLHLCTACMQCGLNRRVRYFLGVTVTDGLRSAERKGTMF